MRVWRIANRIELDGAGGLHAAGRWHSKGRPIVYCAPNPATALLEVLVHMEIEPEDFPANFKLLKIEIDDAVAFGEIAADDLPPDWTVLPLLTRRLGDDWLTKGRTALLQVPCAIVPETFNLLVNPAHPDAKRMRVLDVVEHPLDRRLRGFGGR